MLTKKDKYLAAAQKFLERGQGDRALEELARIVDQDPGDARTRLKMAEIHAQRGELAQARDIYLATADVYLSQGLLDKAATLFRSVLKLMPRQPGVRERLADTYRQLGRVGEALRELDLAATEFAEAGRPAEALPALRRLVGLEPDNVVSRIKLAEMASQVGATDEAVRELRHAAEQLKHQGRTDEYVRVAERLLHHRPDDFGLARELAAAYVARRNPRLAIAKLQGPLRAAPREPSNVALFAQALALIDPAKAISVWRELAEIHDVAGRPRERDGCVRAALTLDPMDGETRELAARWGVAFARRGASRGTPPPVPGAGHAAEGTLTPPPLRSVSGAPVGGVAGSGLNGPLSALSTPADVDRVLAQADVFVKYGLAERAVDHLRRVLAIHPNHRDARERLATVFTQLGRDREAAAELATLAALRAQAEADEPAAPAIDEGDVDVELGAEHTPTPEELLADLEQVDFFVDQAMFEEARVALAELEERFPRDARLNARRRALDAAAGPGEAGAVPGHLPGAPPQMPVAKLDAAERADSGTHGDLGIAYKQMGLYDAAVAEFTQVLRDRSRAVFALTMIGECLESKDDLGEAVARYKEALNMPQVTPTESLELFYLLGAVFERLGDQREALYFFENVVKREPRFRDVQRRVAALRPQRVERA